MNQTNKQAEKVALVTGAARRIGAAVVKQLHDAGFKVVIHCFHSLTEAKKLARTLNQRRANSALVLQCDLSIHESSQEVIADTIAWASRLDLLVNNASIFACTDFTEVADQIWNDLFTLNVKAPFLVSLSARPHLAKQQGVIINLTDIHAHKPLKNYSVYCQTKAALAMQTKALAKEFAPEVRVNAIAPGAIIWPEHENALSPEIQNEIIHKIPLKRHGDPLFIAQAVLALAQNPFITGQILNVDGGRSIE